VLGSPGSEGASVEGVGRTIVVFAYLRVHQPILALRWDDAISLRPFHDDYRPAFRSTTSGTALLGTVEG
jgi:hypothetical protein